MNVKLKKSRNNKFRNFSPDYSFKAPPYNMYSAFRPGGYYRMYHRVEAEKMKRSHEWVISMLMAEKANTLTKTKSSQKEIPPVKTHIKEGVLIVEIGENNKELVEEFQ